MEYTLSNDSVGRTAAITGRVTFKEQGAFRTLIAALFDEDNTTYILDLSAVSHIDSAGLGMLLIARKHAEAKGAKSILRNPPATVRTTLELAKFHELFTIQS